MPAKARSTCVATTPAAPSFSEDTGIHLNTGWVGLAGAVVTTPTGAVQTYAAAAAPTGWLICDGSAVSRTTYADLFGVISATYGNGDGSTTFNLPDLRGRVVAGYAASGGHTDVSTLALTEGVAAANRRPKHQTSKSDPGHAHDVVFENNGSGFSFRQLNGHYDDSHAPSSGDAHATGAALSTTTGITVGTGNANDAVDAPAYIVLNHIIKT